MDSTTKQQIESYLRAVIEQLDDESGVTAIEYGLLAALIAVAAIAAFAATGDSLEAVFVYWSNAVAAAL